MYGTVAHLKFQPGRRPDLVKLFEAFQTRAISFTSGGIALYLFQLDEDRDRAVVVAVFDARDSYRANAESREQGEVYSDLRALLADDPEWYDGEIIPYMSFGQDSNGAGPMFGTVAHMRTIPGGHEALEEYLRNFDDPTLGRVPGSSLAYLFQLDRDPQEVIFVSVFESREAYLANARSQRQDERYRALRKVLESEPRWHDGEVLRFTRF
jgi:heme-degrading monooxygenase HmoA